MASLVMSLTSPSPRSPGLESLSASAGGVDGTEALPLPGTLSLPLSAANVRTSHGNNSSPPNHLASQALTKPFADWPPLLDGFQSQNLPRPAMLHHPFQKTDLGLHLAGPGPDGPLRSLSLHLPPPPTGAVPSIPRDMLLQKNVLDLKESPHSPLGAWSYPLYYPYDGLPPYSHVPPGYGLSFDAMPRKNATRESTATLKAWLNEHKKNPYPTKGEKIMLAIITKMTLTQVSTWFANARRRLKKENKMTWEPRNKTDDDDAKLSDDEDDEKEAVDKEDDDIKKDDKDGDSTMGETKVEDGQTELKSCDGGAPTKGVTAALSPTPSHHPFAASKGEKIWSLADTAACKTPPPPPPPDNTASSAAAGVWLAGGTTFPLPPTIPPTNSSSQSQYPRFSHLMPGALPSQYMASSYNEGVGTDTPPQTPPNAKGSNGGAGGGQTGLLGGAGSFMGASSAASGGYGMGSLSSCSRGSSGLPMPGSDVTMNPAGQRYSNGNGVQVGQSSLNSTNSSSMVSTAFTPVYKSPAQQQQAVPSQQSSQQQVNSSQQQQAHSQQAQQNQQQQVSSQPNVLNSPPSVGSLVPSSYVS